jgi:pimeloyl-ACP methyl ester carboxylesterase
LEKKNDLWTESGARLQLVKVVEGKNYHWLFLPGGPGLGSDSLFPLFDILELPGNLWRLDLPGDGSNIGDGREISHWPGALLEAANAFEPVIMVGHSRGGMFLLALPELEEKICGLVLMDSAPDRGWMEEFASKVGDLSTPEEQDYQKAPSNRTLEKFILAGAPYMFTEEHLEKGRKSLEGLPYNDQAIRWTQRHFDPSYSAKWVPKDIPTLIFSGSWDLPTPLKLFSERKEFLRKNIILREIEDAGHFPWIENPQAVIGAFQDYLVLLEKD